MDAYSDERIVEAASQSLHEAPTCLPRLGTEIAKGWV
jgi:hypothetical protein